LFLSFDEPFAMKARLSILLLACLSLVACMSEPASDMQTTSPEPYVPVAAAQVTRTELAPALYELA